MRRQKAGGVVLTIDEAAQHNHLALFFVFSEYHSQGLGLAGRGDAVPGNKGLGNRHLLL